MRLVMSFLALTALGLAACERQAGEVAVDAETAATEAEEFGMDDPDAPFDPDPAMTSVTFEPMSRTAEAFTGAITLESQPRVGPNAPPRMKLTTATGLTYITELSPGAEQQGVDWGILFNAPIDVSSRTSMTSVDLHIVQEETGTANAPNGGLCGATPVFAIAMATPIDGPGGSYVGLAAFSGSQWPPTEEAALCGIYNYLPPR